MIRWRGAHRPGVRKRAQSVRARASSVPVRARRPRCAWTDVPQGPIHSPAADLPASGDAQTAHAPAAAAAQEARSQRLPVLLSVAQERARFGDAAAGARRHGQAVRRRLRAQDLLCRRSRGEAAQAKLGASRYPKAHLCAAFSCSSTHD